MEFESFWKQYPRKTAKAISRKQWDKLSTAQQQQAMDALPAHVAYWKALGTEPAFIPHARTWLYQERWEDELEVPEKKESKIQVAWWQSEQTMLEKGRELGTQPRPGEDWTQFKGRLIQMMQRAA